MLWSSRINDRKWDLHSTIEVYRVIRLAFDYYGWQEDWRCFRVSVTSTSVIAEPSTACL